MTETIEFYNRNAQSFFDNTVGVDASELHRKFLSQLPEKARILDAGCGSGRDSKAFVDKGYQVHAFDASSAMVSKASELTGLAVTQSSFIEYQSPNYFDGIWACASLLHVPLIELSSVFNHLSQMLKPSGIIYCSFKLGDSEEFRGGRHFTNLTQQSLDTLLVDIPVAIKESWETTDLRPGRESEFWLNAILQKV